MERVKSEDAIGAKGRPFTGAEYLESLRDGREVYVYGERVQDVTTHPAFRNAARSIARLYAQIFPRRTLARRPGNAARCHRLLGAHVLWLDGTFAGLQSVADEYAG